MFGFIIYLLVIGLVAGFIARAVVPGNDSMSVVATIVLGIVGSFIGGFIGYVLTHHDANDGAFQASGIIGSILGAIVALLVYRAVSAAAVVARSERAVMTPDAPGIELGRDNHQVPVGIGAGRPDTDAAAQRMADDLLDRDDSRFDHAWSARQRRLRVGAVALGFGVRALVGLAGRQGGSRTIRRGPKTRGTPARRPRRGTTDATDRCSTRPEQRGLLMRRQLRCRPATRSYDDASTISQHASPTYRTVSSRTRQDEPRAS